MLTGEQRVDRKRKLKLFFGGAVALVGVFVLLLVVEFIQRGMA